jgi:hypothetical protein
MEKGDLQFTIGVVIAFVSLSVTAVGVAATVVFGVDQQTSASTHTGVRRALPVWAAVLAAGVLSGGEIFLTLWPGEPVTTVYVVSKLLTAITSVWLILAVGVEVKRMRTRGALGGETLRWSLPPAAIAVIVQLQVSPTTDSWADLPLCIGLYVLLVAYSCAFVLLSTSNNGRTVFGLIAGAAAVLTVGEAAWTVQFLCYGSLWSAVGTGLISGACLVVGLLTWFNRPADPITEVRRIGQAPRPPQVPGYLAA